MSILLLVVENVVIVDRFSMNRFYDSIDVLEEVLGA